MRPRKSVEEKILAGTFRKDKEPPPDRSEPITKLPPAPARLSREGKSAWRRAGQACIELGTLRYSDLGELEMLAGSLGLVEECERRLRDEGLTLTSESSGITKAHPLTTTLQAARNSAHKIMQHLGMSPTSRQRTGAKRPGGQLAPMALRFPTTIAGGKAEERTQTLAEFLADDGPGPAAKK
jgi:P27 family predicted phage terminase small subunit